MRRGPQEKATPRVNHNKDAPRLAAGSVFAMENAKRMPVDYRSMGSWAPSFPQIIGYRGITRADKDVFGVMVRYAQLHDADDIREEQLRTAVIARRLATDAGVAPRSVRRSFARLTAAGLISPAGTTRTIHSWKYGQDVPVWQIHLDVASELPSTPLEELPDAGEQPPLPFEGGDRGSPLDGPPVTPPHDRPSVPLVKIDLTTEPITATPPGPRVSERSPTVFDDALGQLKTKAETVANTPEEELPGAGYDPKVVDKAITITRRTIHDMYVDHQGYPPGDLSSSVVDVAHLALGITRARKEKFSIILVRMVSGFLADDYWGAKKHPLHALAKYGAKWGDPATQAQRVAATVDRGAVESKIGSRKGRLQEAKTELQLATSHRDVEAQARATTAISQLKSEIKDLQLLISGV